MSRRKIERDDLDQVVAICIGLHLPPWLSEVLLDRAGLKVKRYGEFGYFGIILNCFYMDDIDAVQNFLSANGLPSLNLDFSAYDGTDMTA